MATTERFFVNTIDPVIHASDQTLSDRILVDTWGFGSIMSVTGGVATFWGALVKGATIRPLGNSAGTQITMTLVAGVIHPLPDEIKGLHTLVITGPAGSVHISLKG
jgi:hypothetical protein